MSRIWKIPVAISVVSLTLASAACGDKTPAAPTPVGNANLTAPVLASPSDGEQLSTLRPTLTVQNGTSDRNGVRTYEFQISDKGDFSSALTSSPKGTDGRTSFTPDQDLQPTTRFYWRVRMAQESATSAWSATRTFNSRLVGFIRAGELYDPLIHGETVGERLGSTEFIPGKGLRLNEVTSHVRYLLPQTITSGEFSMEVEGLRANAPGDKTKVFGMQEGQDDFITNRYRVDAQYRGAAGVARDGAARQPLTGCPGPRSPVILARHACRYPVEERCRQARPR